MKLEYLLDGSLDCALIRLYDFTPAEVRWLQSAIEGLAAGVTQSVAVHELPSMMSINGSRLTLVRQKWDGAVVQRGPNQFECGFTADTWDNVARLVEPFTVGAMGYQWLAGVPGEAALLLSPDGDW
jgi:hypothetical protein